MTKLHILRVCFDHDCFSLVSKPPWFLRLWNTFFTSHVICRCHAADFPMAPTCAPRLTGCPASHAVAPAAKETEPGRGWRFRSAASSLPSLVPKMGIHLARGGVEVCNILCVCVQIYVYIYMCAGACVCVCKSVFAQTCASHVYTFTYIHKCSYIHTPIYICTCIYIHLHTFTSIYIHFTCTCIFYLYLYIYIHTYLPSIHTCMHTYIHTHTHIHTYIHTCMHACMHASIHTYIHACIHTYIPAPPNGCQLDSRFVRSPMGSRFFFGFTDLDFDGSPQ